MFVPEQESRYQHSFLSVMCCVDWVCHEYHTPSLLPSPKKNPSEWAVLNSASFPTEVKLMAMISVSPLAKLALERDTFALLGQLCIFYAPPPSASDHTGILIWRPAVSASFPDLCWSARGREEGVVWGRAFYLWPSEHTFQAHWSESTTFKQSREPPPVHTGFRSRGTVGILNYFLFWKYCSMLRTAYHS